MEDIKVFDSIRQFAYSHNTISNIKKGAFSMHTHNGYELILIKKGDVTHVVEDRKYKLSKNDLIIIRPSLYHYIQVNGTTDYERYNILINENAFKIDKLDEISKEIEVINLSSNPTALELFNKIDFYKQNLNENEFKQVSILLIKELFFNLSIYKEKNKQYSALSPILSQALSYINENLFTIKSVEEIAKRLFVSSSFLFRIFKKELKTSPKKYINDKRLLSAQNLLCLGKTPMEIFEECGFNDYTAFYRSYVNFFGYPPSKEKTQNFLSVK